MSYSLPSLAKPKPHDWAKWFGDFRPYAATTFQFNERLSRIGGGDTATDHNIAHAQRRIFEVSKRIDQFYSKTCGVSERIAKRDRFDAICVVEKASVSPHVHLAWFHRQEHERNTYINDPQSPKKAPPGLFGDMLDETIFDPIDKKNRLMVLLQCLNRSHLTLSPEDSEFLTSFRADRFRCQYSEPIPQDTLFDWKHRGWSVRTESTYSNGWDRYISKELAKPDASDRLFFLSDAFGEHQRIKPTRYHTIDNVTGSMTLNLDEPPKARK